MGQSPLIHKYVEIAVEVIGDISPGRPDVDEAEIGAEVIKQRIVIGSSEKIWLFVV
jgi:hypothetical protein